VDGCSDKLMTFDNSWIECDFTFDSRFIAFAFLCNVHSKISSSMIASRPELWYFFVEYVLSNVQGIRKV